ncbi:MAG TPA: histidine ammonia-lyase [Elusimicrobiales bacterium]|nr:histidine ammonia-lyase [Elusimicrobiales bacterium]HOL62232.1 histidine ammonia-lyase [Elusimicrobiales bacterium]HPO94879.1 histidine ammonia-lyase [Elusimicrobiales bacterium]
MKYSLPYEFKIEELEEIISGKSDFSLSSKARKKINLARKKLVSLIDSGKTMYGINTGFGELASKSISKENLKQLQLNLIRSHSCGVGYPLSDEEVRLLMFIRANELSRGASGVRAEVIDKICEFLNKGAIPFIPEKGSVGASGDLAPSSHMALALCGEGFCKVLGEEKFESSDKILKRLKIKPLVLEEKEGLALINGTQATNAIGSISLLKALKVFHSSILAGALTVDALKGTPRAFDSRISDLKPHPGQSYVAKRLSMLLEKSEIRESHKINDSRVQDPYSLRCMPQVMGGVMDNLYHCVNIVEREFKSVTDNPLVFFDGKEIDVVSGGNFHAQSLAFAFDIAAMVMTANGNISERRIAQLVSDFKILPPFLAKNPGLESGFMIAHVTAAALCNENNILSHPASASSVPTSANKEDFVSMGTNAALKLRTVVENVSRIVAIELIASTKAIGFHRPLKTSPNLEKVMEKLKSIVGDVEGDVEFSSKIEAVSDAILNGEFIL